MPRSAASSIASEVGAPTPTRIGAPATAAFCTSSNASRPLTQRIAPASGTRPSSSARPITLSIALWRPTSSRTISSSPRRVEQAGRVQAAGALEGRLAQAVGQRREQVAVDARAGAERRRVHRDLLERALAADPARGRRVEAARARVAQQRAGDLDDVRREVLGQARRRAARRSGPRRSRKPSASSSSWPGRAHRHGERLRRRRGSPAVPRPRPRRAHRRGAPTRSCASHRRAPSASAGGERGRVARRLGASAARRPRRPCTPGSSC